MSHDIFLIESSSPVGLPLPVSLTICQSYNIVPPFQDNKTRLRLNMPYREVSITASKDISLHTVISTPQNPSDRPALLLLHFWGGCNRTYRPLIKLLDNKYTIIAPSLRGWGQSSRPDDPKAYRMTDHAADFVGLLQNLRSDEPELLANGVVLVGHSMGGKIAQLLPTYTGVGPLVKGVILVAPAPTGSFALPEDMREQQIHGYDSTGSAYFVVANVLLGKPDNVTEDIITDTVSDAVSASSGARAAWPRYGMAEDYEGVVAEGMKKFTAAGISPKVLVVVGELDRVETPANVERRVAKVLGNAGADVKTESLSDIGHLIPLEAPQKLASALTSFVDSL